MQFPLKAKGPSTFDLDYWRLSISDELVHDCENDLEFTFFLQSLLKNADQLTWMHNSSGRAQKECFNTTIDVANVKVKETMNPAGQVQEFSPSNWKKANRKRDPMERYLDELPN